MFEFEILSYLNFLGIKEYLEARLKLQFPIVKESINAGICGILFNVTFNMTDEMWFNAQFRVVHTR